MILSLFKWLLIIIFLFASTFYLLFSPSHLPEVHFNGKSIKIQRDEYGIATINVATIQEMLYAMGTLFAEDRLFQMAFRAYSVQGRLSQFLGERPLQYDRFMREVNLKGWAQKRAARLQAENASQYSKMCALTQGINERVGKMAVLPVEFKLTGMKWQNFTINHLFYIDILLEWSLSMGIVDEYTRSILLANYTIDEIDWIFPNKKEFWAFDSVPIVRDAQIPDRLRTENVHEHLEKIKFNPLSVERPIAQDIIQFQSTIDASNAWAVSGEHTQTGRPILSSDPHLQAITPSHWYQFLINYTLPDGTSWFSSAQTTVGNARLLGKTPYYTVAPTSCHGDNQDLFREKVQGNKYLVDGAWRDLKVRNETIKVKTSSGIRQEIYQVRQTHRGPIIHYIFSALGSFNTENDTLSMAWTGYNDEWESFTSFADNILINNFQQLKYYLNYQTKTFYNLNMVVITADNHIVLQQAGLQPIRRNIDSGNYIKDGTTTQHDWVGIVPPQDRVYIEDPPKGYIVTANNRLAEGGYYGGYLNFTTFTARGDRLDEEIRAEIAAGRKIGKQFMKRMMYDTVDVYCREILPEILEVVEQARPLLSNFTCNFSAASYQAALYEVFYFELYQSMKPFHPEKMSLITFHYMHQGIYNYMHFAYKGNQTKQEVMRKAWRKMLAKLEEYFKTKDYTQWQWGKFHIDANRHIPFKSNPFLSYFYDRTSPGCGNAHTTNVAKMERLQFGNFQTTHRANMRLLYGYGEYVDEWICDGGVSENILSGHFNDQIKLFLKNQMIPVFPKDKKNYKNAEADL